MGLRLLAIVVFAGTTLAACGSSATVEPRTVTTWGYLGAGPGSLGSADVIAQLVICDQAWFQVMEPGLLPKRLVSITPAVSKVITARHTPQFRALSRLLFVQLARFQRPRAKYVASSFGPVSSPTVVRDCARLLQVTTH